MFSVQSNVFRDFYVKVKPSPVRRDQNYLVYELADHELDIELTARGIKTGVSRHLFVHPNFDPAVGIPVEVYLVDLNRENVKLWVGECQFTKQ
ncbi:hypothetical protein M5G25_18975 [Pseudomonas sp. TNT2022 ID357]|uniref:Uncharacterized protein n=1 Tax=Pseudomonas idahonensis TaxID=2942628 RepID=A0ABT5Q9G0_9PSED|nr:hypothetical protein [Pseudomonas idahonensis]MDD1150366.1 hypothetical protein [Pseudomonas idahonensis]